MPGRCKSSVFKQIQRIACFCGELSVGESVSVTMSFSKRMTSKLLNTITQKAKPVARLFFPNINTLVLLYFLAMVLLLREKINTFLVEQVANQITTFYTLLCHNKTANWLTTLLFVSLGVYISWRILKRKTYSWLIILCAFAISYLIVDDRWVWAKTCLFISYRCLLILIFISFLACAISLLVVKIKNTPRIQNKKQEDVGFSVTTESDSMEDTGWQQYAVNLVGKILETDVSRESFAVGLAGIWGSGKTTFLNTIREELKGKVYLIDFNPWNSDSATQLSNDFFKSLNSALTISSFQRHSILQYARLLSQLNTFGTQAKMVSLLFDNTETPIEEAKERVAGVIGSMPLPVVVLIDDLDRLDGEELMAVMRLIRVTANFKNLIFIVAYDKEYVTQTLAKVGVVKGEEFLKKIFPLEVCLPAFESFVLANQLYGELKNCLRDESIIKLLAYRIYRGSSRYSISHYLPTFRDVKRFVNQFSLNINSFIKTNQLNEIDIPDFFVLELLHYYDFDAYQQIQYQPLSLLDYGYNIQKRYTYSYRQVGSIRGVKEIEEKDERRAKILTEFKEGVPDLLWALFGSTAIRGENHLRYPTNFSKYFSYRINKDVIGLEEFRRFLELDTKEAIEEKVRDFCYGDVSRRASLKHHLTSLNIDPNNEKQAFNASYALLELALYRGIDPGPTFKVMYDRSRFKEFGSIPNALINAIQSKIGTEGSARIIQEILTSLVEYDFLDQADENGGHVEYASVLNWGQLKELAEENFMCALGGRKIAIQQITDETSRFHDFLSSAVARVSIECYDGEHEEIISKSLLLDKLVDIYSQQDNKTGLKFFFNNLAPRDDDYLELEEYEYCHDRNKNIASIFGSTYKNEDFYSFVEKAFAGYIEEVNIQLKNLRMEEISIWEIDASVDNNAT